MTSEPATGVLAIHHRIANDLRARIEAGEWAPGDPLPTISQLQEQWRCSDGSVRNAMDVLRAEGRITSGRGKPATVRHPPTRIQLWSGWAQEQKDLVLRPRSERESRGAIEMLSGIPISDIVSTHHYDIVPADADLAKELGIATGAELSRRQYEMTDPRSGHRLSYSVSYIPKGLIEANPDLLDETNEPWPGGHQHQLYTVGIELAKFIRSVIATEPTAGDRQKWGMEPGVPIIRVRSRSIDVHGRVVEVSDATYPADRTEIMFADELTRWPDDHPRFDITNGDH